MLNTVWVCERVSQIEICLTNSNLFFCFYVRYVRYVVYILVTLYGCCCLWNFNWVLYTTFNAFRCRDNLDYFAFLGLKSNSAQYLLQRQLRRLYTRWLRRTTSLTSSTLATFFSIMFSIFFFFLALKIWNLGIEKIFLVAEYVEQRYDVLGICWLSQSL